MSTIVNQKDVEFYPYKSVAMLYDGGKDVWRIVGIRDKQLNTILYEGEDEEQAEKLFDMILENDK